MPHTNQLIEELREKMLLDFDQRPETQRAIALDFLRKAISQTEQECDKKWGERIESKKKSEDKWSKRNNSQVLWTDIGYNQALDDLLNNK